jgi:hypothetical protein
MLYAPAPHDLSRLVYRLRDRCTRACAIAVINACSVRAFSFLNIALILLHIFSIGGYDQPTVRNSGRQNLKTKRNHGSGKNLKRTNASKTTLGCRLQFVGFWLNKFDFGTAKESPKE